MKLLKSISSLAMIGTLAGMAAVVQARQVRPARRYYRQHTYLVSNESATPQHPFGLGAVLGTTSGFTFKYIRDWRIAYDGTIGWGGSDNYRITGDILWQKPRIFQVNDYFFDAYFGGGGRVRDRGQSHSNSSDNGFQAGLRGVGGVRYMFADPRIEVFGELALIMDVVPSTDADFDIGIGGRYYF